MSKDPMFNPERRTDPRKLPGSMTGGGPHEHQSTIIDTRHAVVLDGVNVCAMATQSGKDAVALLLSGRVVRSADRADVLFLMDPGGAASIITALFGLLSRATGHDPSALVDNIMARMEKLRAEGNLT